MFWKIAPRDPLPTDSPPFFGVKWLNSVTNEIFTAVGRNADGIIWQSNYISPSIKTVNTNYSTSQTKEVILVDASASSITITLSPVSKEIYVKKIDSSSNNVTINSEDGSLIDNQDSYTLITQNDSIYLLKTNTGWKIL